MKIEQIINQIHSSDAIILEGAISVLSVLSSDDSNNNGFRILKIILPFDEDNKNAKKILKAAKTKNLEADKIEFFSPEQMRELENILNDTGIYQNKIGRTHGGIIAITSKRKFLTPRELIYSLKPSRAVSVAIIEGIEDPYNLGYAARALYTQGIDALILPERDFGFSESIIEKASTGTFSKMPTAVFSNDINISDKSDINSKIELINFLKSENFRIYCIDKKIPASLKAEISCKNIFDVEFSDRTVFIIGGEKRGISKDFLNNADEIVSIPYAKNFSHSLAAQTAATIVSYEIHRQKSQLDKNN